MDVWHMENTISRVEIKGLKKDIYVLEKNRTRFQFSLSKTIRYNTTFLHLASRRQHSTCFDSIIQMVDKTSTITWFIMCKNSTLPLQGLSLTFSVLIEFSILISLLISIWILFHRKRRRRRRRWEGEGEAAAMFQRKRKCGVVSEEDGGAGEKEKEMQRPCCFRGRSVVREREREGESEQ